MDKKKRDYLSYTLLFQAAICLLMFGTLYGLKTINSEIYTTVKADYFENINENFDFLTTEPTSEKDIDDNLEKVTIQEKTTETTTVSETNESELKANIQPKSSINYNTESINELPSNVSVNSYTLNKKMVMPVTGEITSKFGVRNHPIYNELRFHAGVDIAAKTGTPIYSAFTGTVEEVKYDNWNGNYLKISHEGTIETVYCHCEKISVKKGAMVNAGDVVAYVGSTGVSTGPHLHFELRVNNISYDPITALNEAVSAV